MEIAGKAVTYWSALCLHSFVSVNGAARLLMVVFTQLDDLYALDIAAVFCMSHSGDCSQQ